MKYIELSGSLLEIGRIHGEAFREDIRGYYEFYCQSRGKTPGTLPAGIRSYMEDRLPDAVEEMRGIAEGAGMEYEEILVYNHFNVISGCTPVFFRDSDRGPLVGQTLDCEPEELEAVLVRNVRPDRGLGYIGLSFAGTVWPAGFLNSAGLGKGAVSAHHTPYLSDNGANLAVVDSSVARNASSLEEVFELLKPHRLVGKIGVQLYAHESGRAIFIEGDGLNRWKVPVEGDFGFSTGLFMSGNVKEKNEPGYLRPKFARKDTIDSLHAGGKIEFTLDGMKKLFAHHAPDPGSVCRHNPEEGLTTQSARICVLRERKLLVTEGPPCESEYVEFSLND
jgi:isopenicillin-N N-acyltransferase like protein